MDEDVAPVTEEADASSNRGAGLSPNRLQAVVHGMEGEVEQGHGDKGSG